MNKFVKWPFFIIFFFIPLIFTACKNLDTSFEDPLDTYIDEVAPTVSSAESSSDGSLIVLMLVFSEPMDTSSIAGDSSTTCSASIQVSKDDFALCVPVYQLSASTDNKTFTAKYNSSDMDDGTYECKISTAVKDIGGNGLSSSYNKSFTVSNGTTDGTLSDETITTINGLYWQDNGYEEKQTWNNAADYCSSLVLGDRAEFRLPTKVELLDAYDNKELFQSYAEADHQYDGYWTSNEIDNIDDEDGAWHVVFSDGAAYHGYKSNVHYIRCVSDD
jgi:hypothetical protein